MVKARRRRVPPLPGPLCCRLLIAVAVGALADNEERRGVLSRGSLHGCPSPVVSHRWGRAGGGEEAGDGGAK